MTHTASPPAKPNAHITQEKLEQFDRDGFLIMPGVFSPAEVGNMRTEADYILELIINSSLANKRRSGRLDWNQLPDGAQVVRKIQPINDMSIFLQKMSEDPRLLAPMRGIMGDEPILMEEKLNYKQPLTEPVKGMTIREADDRFPVHNDWAYYAAQNYPQTILSSAISMDECTAASGPIRVWPGSHKTHLEHQVCDFGLEVKPTLIDHGGGMDVLAPAGTVMFFHSLLVHNSTANVSGKPRRLMIYSHYPKSANMGYDVRNGPGRMRETPWERQYTRMKDAGIYRDTFKAPVAKGHENGGVFWVGA